MESLPIDINYNKLLDWLISRRHCLNQWQPSAAVIRQKIIHAIESLGDSESASQLFHPITITYFEIKELIDQAKDTDEGKKNFFGQYASQTMKDWAEIIRLYEKDGIYLAETAQMLARNVNYEIPAIKKQISRCQQLQKECERKEAEFANTAVDLRKKYAASCKQIGIEGKKIKTELAALVQDLPTEFDRIAASVKELDDVVHFYDHFIAFLLNKEATDSLPMLKFIRSRGNAYVFEWRTGSPPEVTEEQRINIDLSDEQDVQAQSDDIDWGGTEAESGIDFGDEIDFGISDITLEASESSMTESIDWGVTDEATASLPEDGGVTASGVARGEDALTVLDNPNTRNLFIDDLMEESAGHDIAVLFRQQGSFGRVHMIKSNFVAHSPLKDKQKLPTTYKTDVQTKLHNQQGRFLLIEVGSGLSLMMSMTLLLSHVEVLGTVVFVSLEAFLIQRVRELSVPESSMSGSQFQGAAADIQLNVEEVSAMLHKAQHIVGQLASMQMQHLMLIRSSPRYVDRLRDSLRQTLVQADKLGLNGQEMASRRRAALEEEKEVEPRLEKLRKQTRYMQKHLQAEIEDKYKGRQVNIMGEINMI